MVYTIHGAVPSTCTRRVLTAAIQIGADIKVDEVEFTKIYTPEWTEHQPFNQMPYLSDSSNNFETFESRAMAKYIAIKEGSDLVPSTNDVIAYAKFDQACSIEQSNFDPSASGLASELVFGPARGATPDQKRVETLTATLAKRLEGYERILSKQKYLAGDKLTLADIFHLPYGKMAVDLGKAPGLVDGSLPNVTRWWKELTELPAWEKANNWGNDFDTPQNSDLGTRHRTRLRHARQEAASTSAAWSEPAPTQSTSAEGEATSSRSKKGRKSTTAWEGEGDSATTAWTSTEPAHSEAASEPGSSAAAHTDWASTAASEHSPAPSAESTSPSANSTSASSPAAADVTVTQLFTVGPSPTGVSNGATLLFPRAHDWWVLNNGVVVQWAPALPEAVDIVLTNPDGRLMPWAYYMSSAVPPGFTSMRLSVANPAIPGQGYMITLRSTVNQSHDYAISEPFEIRRSGERPLVPSGFATITAVNPDYNPQGLQSGAGRPAGVALAVAACALALAWA
ncbi:hypothetical protein Q8F55_006404 [Vanrija albida]|uniref:glutathione transferase n=1 Tax=Vanrija albida TaxID=181172 RepID=A0ABR3PX38_9TREE